MRNAPLDGVRGLASLMVAVCHFVTGFHWALLNGEDRYSHFAGDTAISHSFLVFFFNPDLGVAIFFVLSGYVLAASVARDPPPWPALAVRRWIRLSLPILATSILIWLTARAGGFHSTAAAELANSDWLKSQYGFLDTNPIGLWILARDSLFSFLTSVPQGGGAVRLYNSNSWTMPIEMIGSLALYAAYCVFGDLARRARGCLGAAGIAVVITYNTPFDGFGGGIALFELGRAIQLLPSERRAQLAHAAAPFGAVAIVLGVWLGGTPFNIDLPGNGAYARAARFLFNYVASPITQMHHAGAILIVAAALTLRSLQRVLSTRPCQYLGRISFMMYLVQIPVLCSVGAYVVLGATRAAGYNPATLLALAAYLAATILIAHVTTAAIDVPSIRLSRIIGARITLGRRALAVQPNG